MVPGSQVPTLLIAPDPIINAFGNSSGVAVTYALAELISDSQSELAFVLAHELGHVYQQRSGRSFLFSGPANVEADADAFGTWISMAAGYDPYAGAGALAKLNMATGQAGLVAQFFDQFSGDLHGSFNTRIDLIFQTLKTVCAQTFAAQTCAQYKQIFHPHFPIGPPLSPPKQESPDLEPVRVKVQPPTN